MGGTDFDFIVGSWQMSNRRLSHYFGSDWETFPGGYECVRAFDGGATFDEMTFPTLDFSGLTLRLYSPGRDEWSLHWVNQRDGELTPPVVGGFTGEGSDRRGVFYGEDRYDGQDVRVRFVYSDITPTSVLWEQSFSVDGDQTWRPNWVIQFLR